MSGKCKVLLVHNYYRIPGGEDTVVHNEKAMLERHGHEVVTYFRRNEEIAGMPLWRKLLLPFTAIFSLRTYCEVRRIIRTQQIEVVHVHNWLALVSPSVYYAALSCGIPVVQTTHNYRMQCAEGSFFRAGRICTDCVSGGLRCALRHRCYHGSFGQTLVCTAAMWLHRRLGIYRHLHYVCMTDFNRRKLTEANEAAGRVIYDPSHMHIKPHFTAAAKTASAQASCYLFIGRIERIKGVELLVKAFARMPEHSLVLAGTGTGLEHYQAEAAKSGCTNISFAGFCNREKLAELLAQAKAVIVPSQYYEPFGMVIIEAYAHGVPVIAGRVGGFPQLVQQGETGLLFDYDSVDSLCEAVRSFEGMRDVDWSGNARRTHAEHYTEEANYARMAAIYTEVKAKPQP